MSPAAKSETRLRAGYGRSRRSIRSVKRGPRASARRVEGVLARNRCEDLVESSLEAVGAWLSPPSQCARRSADMGEGTGHHDPAMSVRLPQHGARSHAIDSIGVERLLARADATLLAVASDLDSADHQAPVSKASRYLCAALGVLAEACHTALGGGKRTEAVGHAAARLALLTKIDDEVIDAGWFHGGRLRRSDDAELAHRVRTYLRPTLVSLSSGRAQTDEPRCAFAASVGQELRALASSPGRWARLLEIVAHGWEVQVRGVVALSRHPEQTAELEVAKVTAEISGTWLLMITMVGALPDTCRGLTSAEERAFDRWGWFIQRADALADFGKDHLGGLAHSYAGLRTYARAPRDYVEACRAGDVERLYRLLCDTEADLDCVPSDTRPIEQAQAALAQLGDVPAWLTWIHGFLLWRYLIGPGPRSIDDPRMSPFMNHIDAWSSFVAAVAAR